MTSETFRITKVPTLSELKELNWIQFVYPSRHIFKGYPRDGDVVYEKQCLRYKVLKNGNCKCMVLYYSGYAGWDSKMRLDTDSSYRNWADVPLSELYYNIDEVKKDKTAYIEANGDKKEFSSRLSGKRITAKKTTIKKRK